MEKDYNLEFISQEDFEKHVENTIKKYNKSLESMDLTKFNSNLIDPIKLLFDWNNMHNNFEEVINLEIQRQRDKTNNNVIGYFHQEIFKYFKNCIVPKNGWDVIFKSNNTTYYVEMKNKHNTMNSSSSAKTYEKMEKGFYDLNRDKNKIFALVEIIAEKSQNEPWILSNKTPNENIKRISIDKFYEIVTSDPDAFKKMCLQLPKTIKKIKKDMNKIHPKDTVLDEIFKSTKGNNKKDDDKLFEALYKLVFSTYNGF